MEQEITHNLTGEQYRQLQLAACTIGDLLNIMKDYVEFNLDNKKIYPLNTLLEFAFEEYGKLTENF